MEGMAKAFFVRVLHVGSLLYTFCRLCCTKESMVKLLSIFSDPVQIIGEDKKITIFVDGFLRFMIFSESN